MVCGRCPRACPPRWWPRRRLRRCLPPPPRPTLRIALRCGPTFNVLSRSRSHLVSARAGAASSVANNEYRTPWGMLFIQSMFGCIPVSAGVGAVGLVHVGGGSICLCARCARSLPCTLGHPASPVSSARLTLRCRTDPRCAQDRAAWVNKYRSASAPAAAAAAPAAAAAAAFTSEAPLGERVAVRCPCPEECPARLRLPCSAGQAAFSLVAHYEMSPSLSHLWWLVRLRPPCCTIPKI